MLSYRLVFVPLAALGLSLPFSANAQIPMGSALPIDPAITVGELENGLRYYIRQNSHPENRAELRLVVNAGSVLEDDTQLGLAHLVEHMAFNGTENFEEQELIDYLESIGMAFGPSVNAYTSFDETVYMLQVPTEDPETVATAFQILEDWAHQVSFDPEEIDKERGVVIEEWRLGRGAQARIRDQQLPILFADSRYAERLPIGKVELLQNFPHEDLIRYYSTWYRPDLMAVVAVGDFDSEEIEQLIQTHFNRVQAPETPLERPYFDIPDHTETYYAIASDPEATGSEIVVLAMQDPRIVTTVGDYREALVDALVSGMMNNRLQELTQQADPPFVAAFSGRGEFVRAKSAFQIGALVQEDGHERGLEALFIEAERAARHGFTEGELERQKLDLLRELEQIFNDRENQESLQFASEYVNHFLKGDAIPGIEFEYMGAQALMETIDLDFVNETAQANLEQSNQVVLAAAIDKPGLTIPSQEDLQQVLAEVTSIEIEPYVDATLDQPLVPEPPEPGSIISESVINELDMTVWTLSNGVTVWLKPTDFKEDEIAMQATSPGGWSNSSLDEHQSATIAAGLVQQGGVGAFSAIELQKALAGKAVQVSPSIDQNTEGLSGSASPEDLETMLQLVWLYFTSPRQDETAFQAFMAQGRAVLENLGSSPMAAFADTFSVTMANGHPRFRPLSLAVLDEIDLETGVDFYKERFADASDFTFVFVGAIDLNTIRPLAEQYLGSLPTIERTDSHVDLDMDPPDTYIQKTVRAGVEPQSQTIMAFTGPFDYTAENRVGMRVMAQALELRLRERMREDLGGTYGVRVTGDYEQIPEERYTVTVAFGSDPLRAEELRGVVFEELRELQGEGPSQEDVGKVVEGERRQRETNMQLNPYWAIQLIGAQASSQDPRFLLNTATIDAVTIKSIQEDAQRYLNEDRVVIVTLLPTETIGRP